MRKRSLCAAAVLMLACSVVPAQVKRPDQPVGEIRNGSFEQVADGQPQFWSAGGPGGQRGRGQRGGQAGAALSIDTTVAADGSQSLVLPNGRGQYRTTVLVKPFAKYRLTGKIRTQDVPSTGGALLAVSGNDVEARSNPVNGTSDWTEVAVEFETGEEDSVYIEATTLAGQGGPGGPGQRGQRGGMGQPPAPMGRVWFDDLKLELVSGGEYAPAVTVNLAERGIPMNELIYGQFIEHLGRCIYGGIWAEMLEDRKFWYSVTDNASPWNVIGGQENVTMVTENAYVGEHAPRINLGSGGTPRGLSQSGLALIEGKGYEGRVILAGDASAAPIRVSLVWGNGESDRETVTIDSISGEFAKYPVKFTAKASTDNGRLEIVGTGSGSFMIGTASIMPDDNVRGMRADTLAALKELDSPVYRWPGGNFVSGYNWKDGIGDPDRRPPRKNPAWQGIEHNDFGMHEYFDFLEEVGAEAFIALNAGDGSAELALEEVEYVLGGPDTPMGKLRAQNGRTEPWECTYWAVGNEMSGDWQIGNVPIDQFVVRHNNFADKLRAFDPTMKLIASGEAVTAYHDWDVQLLKGASGNIDLLSKHFYRQDNSSPGGLRSHVYQIPKAIRDIAEAQRRYLAEIPELNGKHITVSLDEWNYWYGPHVFGELGTRYFLRDGLGIAAGIQEYADHGDVIEMANYAQTVNVIGAIKTNKTNAQLETTGLMLAMYRRHFGTIPVEMTGAPEPLFVKATLTADGSALTIGVVNPTYDEYSVDLKVEGGKIASQGTKWFVAGEDEMAYNDPGSEPVFEIQQATVADNGRLTVAPLSASIFVFPIE